jgi:hypothetical protein
MKNFAIAFFAVGTTFLSWGAAATAQDAQRVPAKLICSAHSGDPGKLRSFQTDIAFELSGGRLTATRKLMTGPGEETFTGTVSSMGAILITGTGNGRNGSTWDYEFRGTRDDKKNTTIRGRMNQTNGLTGSRDCSIVFFKPKSL